MLICELQCIGFEHSEVNAALITVIKKALNESIILT